MSLNILDIILLIPLCWAAWKGFQKGFILEIFSLLALGVGIYGSIHFSDYSADFLRDELGFESKYLPVIAFALTFIGLVIGVYFLGKMVEKAVHLAALKTANKVAGAVFSVIRAALILSVLLIVLHSIDEKSGFLPRKQVHESTLFEPLHNFAGWIIPSLKESDVFEEIRKLELPDLNLNGKNPDYKPSSVRIAAARSSSRASAEG